MLNKNHVIKIPNIMLCPWCGNTMIRKGPTYSGSSINSFTLWCKCGGIAHFAKVTNKHIDYFEIKYNFLEDL